MTTLTSPSPFVWNGEPAKYKGLITAVASSALAIFTGQVTALDGGSAIAAAIAAFAIPVVQAYWTRRSVKPVTK